MDVTISSRKLLFIITIIIFVVGIVSVVLLLPRFQTSTIATVVQPQETPSLSKIDATPAQNTIQLEGVTAYVNQTTTISIPEGYYVDTTKAVPTFLVVDNGNILVSPTKNDIGSYQVFLGDVFNPSLNDTSYIGISVISKVVNLATLKSSIEDYLGSSLLNYGIYFYDLKQNNGFGINETSGFRAASIVKVPIAITILKEIEEGNLTLNTVYPLREDLIFNPYLGIGTYEVGTPFTVEQYLEAMIEASDNTALSHLDRLLNDKYSDQENARIKEVTGVDFYVNPPEASAEDVGKVFQGLYTNQFLTESGSKYIINLMENAGPDLRQAIGSGLPSNVEFANKIGFLDTDEDLSYMDAAIVYSNATDYVLVVLDKEQAWDVAQYNIQQISTLVYNALN